MIQLISADHLAKSTGQRGVVYQVNELGGGLYFWDGSRFRGFHSPGIVYVGPWASKPAASAVDVGSIIECTDVGLGGRSSWWSDGTRYRIVGGSLPIMRHFDPAGVTFAAGAAEARFGSELFMPGGVVQAGMRVRLIAGMSFGGTVDTTPEYIYIRKGAAADAFTDIVAGVTQANGSAITGHVDKNAYILSATQRAHTLSNVLGPGTSTSAYAVQTVVTFENDAYWNMTVTPSAAGTVVMYHGEVILEE